MDCSFLSSPFSYENKRCQPKLDTYGGITRKAYCYSVSFQSSPSSEVSAITAEAFLNRDARNWSLPSYSSLVTVESNVRCSSTTMSKESIFEIKDGFPRLQADNIPNGIISIQYKIELKECKPFEIEISDFDKRISND